MGTEGEGKTEGKEEMTHIIKGDIGRKVDPIYCKDGFMVIYRSISAYIVSICVSILIYIRYD